MCPQLLQTKVSLKCWLEGGLASDWVSKLSVSNIIFPICIIVNFGQRYEDYNHAAVV